jgi:hypothetical protein
MMKSRILHDRLLHIHHPRLLPWLHHHRPLLPFPKFTLLILLRNIARRTTTRTKTIFTSIPLQMVLCAHVTAIQHRHDEGNADAGEATEAHAAEIAAGVAVHVAVVLDAMVRAADNDAGTPP